MSDRSDNAAAFVRSCPLSFVISFRKTSARSIRKFLSCAEISTDALSLRAAARVAGVCAKASNGRITIARTDFSGLMAPRVLETTAGSKRKKERTRAPVAHQLHPD